VLQHDGEPAQRFDPRLLAEHHPQVAAAGGPLAAEDAR
jgi:hypothetical protein